MQSFVFKRQKGKLLITPTSRILLSDLINLLSLHLMGLREVLLWVGMALFSLVKWFKLINLLSQWSSLQLITVKSGFSLPYMALAMVQTGMVLLIGSTICILRQRTYGCLQGTSTSIDLSQIETKMEVICMTSWFSMRSLVIWACWKFPLRLCSVGPYPAGFEAWSTGVTPRPMQKHLFV